MFVLCCSTWGVIFPHDPNISEKIMILFQKCLAVTAHKLRNALEEHCPAMKKQYCCHPSVIMVFDI